MKGLSVLAFFLVFALALGTGLVLLVAGSAWGWLIMGAALLVYLILFAWAGCLSTAH